MPIKNALVPHTHTHTHTLKIGTITSMIPAKKNSTSTKHTQMKGTKLLTPGTNVQEQQFCKRYVVLSRNKQASGTCQKYQYYMHKVVVEINTLNYFAKLMDVHSVCFKMNLWPNR